jgi:DNA-binding GntR family transcriptional regulator
MDLLRLVLNRADEKQLLKVKSLVEDDQLNDDQFFYQLIELADNYLFSRIWLILKDYHHSLNLINVEYNHDSYLMLIEALVEKDEEKTLSAYRQLRNLSILTDKY